MENKEKRNTESKDSALDFPGDFKVHADQMFTQLTELIENVNARIESISNSIGDLETKLMTLTSGNTPTKDNN